MGILLKMVCPNCNIGFDKQKCEVDKSLRKGHRVFCSHKCSCELRSKEAKLTLICKECSNSFIRKKCNTGDGNNFCSHSCSASHSNRLRIGELHHNFKDGKSLYRNVAFKYHPKICMICGFDKEYAIEVHHLDKNRNNNDIENLMVLCANCHSGVHKDEIKI